MGRDVEWNTTKNIMDNFCDQFVDICLASTDLIDSPQPAVPGIVLLLSHLGVFESNFWKVKQKLVLVIEIRSFCYQIQNFHRMLSEDCKPCWHRASSRGNLR